MAEFFYNALVEPLTRPFMQTALLEMVLLSGLVSVVGTYVILRGQAFLTLALSHGIFPGIILAYLLQWDILVVSLVTGVFISIVIGLVGQNRRVGSDSAIAVVYTGMFGLGIVLVSFLRSFRGLSDLLVGRTFAIGWNDLLLTGLTGGVVLAVVTVFGKELLLATFDRTMARSMGLPVTALEVGFLALVTVSVVVALPAVGNIQLVALMVTPPATARLLANRLGPLMVVSVLVALAGSFTGLYLAYHLLLAPGAAIVASLTGVFLGALVFAPGQGLLARLRKPQILPAQ